MTRRRVPNDRFAFLVVRFGFFDVGGGGAGLVAGVVSSGAGLWLHVDQVVQVPGAGARAEVGVSQGCAEVFVSDASDRRRMMERMEMFKKAKQLAYEYVDGGAALSDGRHEELEAKHDTAAGAILELAKQFLENAAYDAAKDCG